MKSVKPSSINLKFYIDQRTFRYLWARLGMNKDSLAWALGYKSYHAYALGQKTFRGLRALCLFYFAASQGYDLRDLLLEAEEAITMKEATRITKYNYKGTLLSLKMIGITPLVKDPLYIRRSDLALLMSPSLASLRDIFNENPLRLWRHERKMAHRAAAVILNLTSERLSVLESGLEKASHEERCFFEDFFGRGFDTGYIEWYERLRAARYTLAAPAYQPSEM